MFEFECEYCGHRLFTSDPMPPDYCPNCEDENIVWVNGETIDEEDD